jgi:hypothetical protein
MFIIICFQKEGFPTAIFHRKRDATTFLRQSKGRRILIRTVQSKGEAFYDSVNAYVKGLVMW